MAETGADFEQYADWGPGKVLNPNDPRLQDLPMDMDVAEFFAMRRSLETPAASPIITENPVVVTTPPPNTEKQMTASRKAWDSRFGEAQASPTMVFNGKEHHA